MKAARERAGLSAQELGDRIDTGKSDAKGFRGVKHLTIYRWEKGERRIDLDTLAQVHKILGLPPFQLLQSAGLMAEGRRLIDLDTLPPEVDNAIVVLLRRMGYAVPGDSVRGQGPDDVDGDS